MPARIGAPGGQLSANADFIPWLVLEYAYNRGGSIKPTLLKFLKEIPGVGASDLFNTMPSYVDVAPNGSLRDPSVGQYLHRLYSAYLFSENVVSVPMSISWDRSLTIQTTVGGTTHELHTSNTSANSQSNFLIPLKRGNNRIDVMLYNHLTASPFTMHVDLSKVTRAFASQLVTRVGEGGLDLTTTADGSTSSESIGDSSGANFLVRKAILAVQEISDATTPGYAGQFDSLTCEVRSQDTNGFPTQAESNGNGFIVDYSAPNGKTFQVVLRWMAIGIGLGS